MCVSLVFEVVIGVLEKFIAVLHRIQQFRFGSFFDYFLSSGDRYAYIFHKDLQFGQLLLLFVWWPAVRFPALGGKA